MVMKLGIYSNLFDYYIVNFLLMISAIFFCGVVVTADENGCLLMGCELF